MAIISDAGLVRVMSVRGGKKTDFTLRDPLNPSYVVSRYRVPGSLDRSGRFFVYGEFELTLVNLRTGSVRLYQEYSGGVPSSEYDDWSITTDHRIVAAKFEGIDIRHVADTEHASQSVTCECAPAAVSLSPSGRFAVFGTADGHMVAIDLKRGSRAEKTITTEPGGGIGEVAASDLGRFFAAVTPRGRLTIWDVNGEHVTFLRTFHGESVRKITAVPGGESFLVQTTPNRADGEDRVRSWLVREERS
ncbi:hypothetical protein ACF1BE_29655 [Streptomyces sp. NPDC014991]|uniref:hypothetical protein n=1 Tax=Streptomyces sp. NPDC014991 TaxID=3364935 RepID=UPI0036F77907